MENKQLFGLLSAAALFAVIIAVPEIKNLEPAGQKCLALFAAVFLLYIFESIPAVIVSVAVVPSLVVLGICDVKDALSGFASGSTYLIVGSFILAAAMLKNGLGRRITCGLLLKIGVRPLKISFGLVVTNIIMAFLIPSSTARTAMLLPLCLSIIHEYRGSEEARARYAANLLLTQCVTSSTISAGIMTSTISNPLAVEYIKNASDEIITFGQWFMWGFPAALIMTGAAWVVIQVFFPVKDTDNQSGREYLLTEFQKMKHMNSQEAKTAAIIGLTVLMWVFGAQIGIDATTAVLIGAVLLFMPGVRVLDWHDCQKEINLGVVFLISGGISLGDAMVKTGTSDWLAESLFSFMPGNTPVLVSVITVIVVIQFMHVFFMGTATMANVFFPILAGLASHFNVRTASFIVPAAFMIGGYPVLTFFNTTPSILCYDTGYLRAADFIKTGIPISIISCILYSICACWYWPMMGLL
jgi:anion transporter